MADLTCIRRKDFRLAIACVIARQMCILLYLDRTEKLQFEGKKYHQF